MTRYIGSIEYTSWDFEESEQEGRDAAEYIFVNTGLARRFFERYDGAVLVLDEFDMQYGPEFWSMQAATDWAIEDAGFENEEGK